MENIILDYNKGSENHQVRFSSDFISKTINQVMTSSNCSEYDAIKFFVETIVSDLKGVTSYVFSWEDQDEFVHSLAKNFE